MTVHEVKRNPIIKITSSTTYSNNSLEIIADAKPASAVSTLVYSLDRFL
jgi:hypothetical protein